MKIALIGNPNSGKSSLFNLLTGANQKISNLPGATVEKTAGEFTINNAKFEIFDLPGIYSLDPHSEEQKVTKSFLIKSKPNLIINILDSSNLERSLYLTLQLRTFGIPVIVLLNMMDEAQKKSIEIDAEKLSKLLNMPAIKTSTNKKSGIDNLKSTLQQINENGLPFSAPCSKCQGCNNCEESERLYKEIDYIMLTCVKTNSKPLSKDLSHYLDEIFVNKYLGLPLFLLIMLLVFNISFSAPSQYLSGLIKTLFNDIISKGLQNFFAYIHAPLFISTLFYEGVIPGVSAVLTFLPQIALLFILLSILEDSGYMTRAAFVADRILSFIGLTGGSFIPMIMGFGCSVPAIMACRTLPSKKDRYVTMMVIPFITCGARYPIIALFAGTFFKSNQGTFVFLMYLLGLIVAFLSAFILGKTAFKNEESGFIMELPPYRMPVFRNLFWHTWDKVKGFLIKAGTTLFAASVVIWFLSNYSLNFSHAGNMKDSIMAVISGVISPLFSPLGFGNWQATSSLITGVGSKEIIVSSLSVLYPQSSGGILSSFSIPAAISFVVFSLLYMPCLSSIVTMSKELKSKKLTVFALAFSFFFAYLISFILFNISKIF